MFLARHKTTLAALGALLVACGGNESTGTAVSAPEPAVLPDFLLITFDTLRADHCSAYGYPRPTTPNMDRVAEQGALFEAAYAVTPTTGPSHATLFTSLYPGEHGVLTNRYLMQDELLTLAEILRDAGYRTGGFVSSYMVNGTSGMQQGFDAFDDEFSEDEAVSRVRDSVQDEKVEGGFDRRGEATTDRALAWLAEQSEDDPVFLWVHYFDPHSPYRPTKESLHDVLGDDFARLFPSGNGRVELTDELRHERRLARYDAETHYADRQVGRVLTDIHARGRGAGVFTLITSDHGEGLNDHGWPGHGVHLFEEAVHVPLVFHWPGRIPAGRRLADPVGLVDVLPTVLRILDIDVSPLDAHGQDLSTAWTGGSLEARPVFLQRRFYGGDVDKFDGKEIDVAGPKIAIRKGRWKLISAPEETDSVLLFDVEADPDELRDVSAEHPDVVDALQREVWDWRREQHARVDMDVAEEIDEESLLALEGLGYVDSRSSDN